MLKPSACWPTARRPLARSKLTVIACASQPLTGCSEATQRAISVCVRSAAPQVSRSSNHSSHPRPVRRRIASSDIDSAGAAVAFGSSAASSEARAAV